MFRALSLHPKTLNPIFEYKSYITSFNPNQEKWIHMKWIHLDVNMIRLSHVKYIFQLRIEPDSENDTKSEYIFMHIRVMCMLITTQKDISAKHQSVYNWSLSLAKWTGIQWKSGVPCSNTMHPTWSAGRCWFTLTVWTCLIALLLVAPSVGLSSDFWITSSSVLCKIRQRTSCFCKITSSLIEGYLRTMPVINQNHLFGFFENHGHTYFRSALRTFGYTCLPFPMSAQNWVPLHRPCFPPPPPPIFRSFPFACFLSSFSTISDIRPKQGLSPQNLFVLSLATAAQTSQGQQQRFNWGLPSLGEEKSSSARD